MIIANFKMNLTYCQEIAYLQNHLEELKTLQTDVVLCPSFLSLAQACELTQRTTISIGAQAVSAELPGAFTGQISAQALHEIGVRYCLVGHSEERAMYEDALRSKETIRRRSLWSTLTYLGIDSTKLYSIFLKKTQQLLENNITPIFCIGEEEKSFASWYFNSTAKAKIRIMEQAQGIQKLLAQFPSKDFYIAYEPRWAIGTGLIPSTDELSCMFNFIKELTGKNPHIKLLYGGSVTSQNISELKSIPGIDGFLIGKASLDFQEFKKIVSCI